MANTNAAGQQIVSDGNAAGVSLGRASTDLVNLYGGTGVAQASAIPAVTGEVSLTTTINAILTVIRNISLIAA